jgi:2-keto-3-deoxy-L-fuconate dehydrogenase
VEAGCVALNSPAHNLNSSRLSGKNAIITGAGSGIGRAIATKFASEGAHVNIVDLDLDAAHAVASEISRTGGTAGAFQCDVSSQSQVHALFHEIFKAGSIHILVNNAGISHVGNLGNTPENDFDKVFRVNVKGYYNCMQAIVDHMKNNGGGTILNLASVAAWAGLADRFAYSMSKGAVVSMTYSVARDYLLHKIRCNSISPARVHTPFVDDYLRKNYPGHEAEMFAKLSATQPIGRMGEPEEVAAFALFLCSDEAAFITGVDYPIDGGFLHLHG